MTPCRDIAMLTVHHTRTEFNTQSCTTAVLPVGAVEQHGKHLPFATDLLLAEALAKPIAQELEAYLLPPIAISASIEHRKAKGTVYLRAETLALVVRDIAQSLRDSGFNRLVIVNFHGGNWILKPTIRALNRDLAGFRVVLLHPDLPAVDAEKIFEHPAGDVHGGEYETSLMLHLYPDDVRDVPTGGGRTFPPQSFLDYFDATELTEEGYWGWPEAATAEKGRRAFEALVASSLRFISQIEEMERTLSAPRHDDVALRVMRPGDVPYAHALRQIAGWNQTEHDWRGYLTYDPDGCFVAEVRGKPAGTATTIHYGRRFGWIGMVLVHPDYRRFGLGTRLLKRAITRLQQCEVRCIKLDATPMGKKVYVPLGFVDEYE
ncbi:MAG: GNAT family N-acetyltransferase, partial [Opitutaceae bacterium]